VPLETPSGRTTLASPQRPVSPPSSPQPMMLDKDDGTAKQSHLGGNSEALNPCRCGIRSPGRTYLRAKGRPASSKTLNGGEGIPCDLGSKTAVDDAETTAVVPRCSIVL